MADHVGVHEHRRVLTAVLAVVFLAITTATWAGVTGPGTTGGQEPAGETGPILVNMPPEDAATPPGTTEVPEPPPFDDVARDLGERKAEPRDAGRGGSQPKAADKPKPAKQQQAPGQGDWKAAKKAAKAECKRRYTGRARGQCISAAARAHKNPKARGRR